MKTIKIVGLVFLIVGLIFAIMGTNEYVTSKQRIDERIYTEAVITRIERYHSSHNDGEILHDVFIQIEVEGKTIESKLNTYNSGMKINDTISVYYYSDNLEYVYEVGSDEAMLLFPIIGGVFAIIGAIFLFSKKAQEFIRGHTMKYNKELFINNVKYLISFKGEPEITLRLKNYEEAFVVAYEDFVDLTVGNKDTIKLNDIEEVFDYINFDDIISIEGDIDYNYPVTSQSIVVDGKLWLDGKRPSEVIAKYNKESNVIRTIFSLISITSLIYIIVAALSSTSNNEMIIMFSMLAGIFLLALILFSYLDKKRNNLILKYYGEVKSIDKTKAQKLLDDIEIIDNCNYDLYDVFRIDEIDEAQIESILKNIIKGNKIHINNYNFLKDIEEEIINNPSKYKDEKVNTYISEVIKLLENNICEI